MYSLTHILLVVARANQQRRASECGYEQRYRTLPTRVDIANDIKITSKDQHQ